MTKRAFDVLVAFLGLLCLFPIFILIGFAIKLESKGSIFFRQERVGRLTKLFRIYKFRTMVLSNGVKVSKITVGKDPRITAVGFFLRRYKLDELPQLINVLLGDMSLVGPRPEVEEYVNYYTPSEKFLIFSIKPGITDLASIKFKDESTILAQSINPQFAYINEILPRKINYYSQYAKKNSLWGDIKIIFLTFFEVVNNRER